MLGQPIAIETNKATAILDVERGLRDREVRAHAGQESGRRAFHQLVEHEYG